MRPFLKWAGNKYQIVARIQEVLPTGKRLIEPFAGSAAVFLNTNFPSYLISDANQDLITLYQHVQTDGETFIEYARTFFIPENNQEDVYYQFRVDFNQADDPQLKSALFLYMNKHGYNGLCRYNQKGKYNVPFGRYKKPYFPEEELRYFCEKSKDATFQHVDFMKAMEAAQPGDVVYCDPPYVPLSSTANFTSYSTGGFGQEQQQQLARMAEKLSQRGIPVIVSNHDTDFVRAEYANAKLKSFDVQRYISCNGKKRGKAAELLAIFS